MLIYLKWRKKKFGKKLDYKTLGVESDEMIWIYREVGKLLYKLGKNYALTGGDSRHEPLPVNENGEDDKYSVMGEVAEQDDGGRETSWFEEHWEICKDTILGKDNPEPRKDQQLESFKMFLDGYPLSDIAIGINLTPDQSKDLIDAAIKLIRAKMRLEPNAIKLVDFGKLMTVRDSETKKDSELRKEAMLPEGLDQKGKVKFVREILGISDGEDFKRRKGHVYLLLKRASQNGGKIVYYPGYHQKNSGEDEPESVLGSSPEKE